jgi:hypothetical protein
MLIHAEPVCFVEVLQNAGDVPAIPAKQFAGIGFLHGLDFFWIEIVNLHARKRVVSRPEFREARRSDQKQPIGERSREQAQGALHYLARLDVVEMLLQC